jgi:hypothetical protein
MKKPIDAESLLKLADRAKEVAIDAVCSMLRTGLGEYSAQIVRDCVDYPGWVIRLNRNRNERYIVELDESFQEFQVFERIESGRFT